MTLLSAWWPALGPALLAMVWTFAPGLAILWAARVRGLALIAFAPLLSIALIAWLPLPLSFIGVAFTRTTFTAGVALIVCAVAGLAYAMRRRWPITRALASPGWPVLVATALAAPIQALAMMRAIVKPTLPPQTWDGVFHINAVRYIVDTGNGSSTAIGAIGTFDLSPRFYPAGWHDLVSLTYTGDVVTAMNATAIIFASVIFPFAIACLMATLVPAWRFAPIIGAFAAISFTALAERPASYGTLWPVMGAYVLLPLVLSALVRFTKRPDGGAVLAVAVAIIGLAGLGLMHPSAIFAATVLGWWILLLFVLPIGRQDPGARWQRWVAILGLIGTPLLLLAVWLSPLFATVTSWQRDPVGHLGREVLGVLADSQLSEQGYGDPVVEWGLFIGLAGGLILALRARQTWWLVPAYASAAYLFVLSAVVYLPGYRLLAPWYFDPVRIGAIVPVIAAPLVALGLSWVAYVIWGAIGQRFLAGVVAVVLVGLALTSHLFSFNQGYWLVRLNYEFKDEDGYNALISPEEVDLQHRLADELPDGAKVIGDPRSGAALLYGIADVDVVYHHLEGDWGKTGYELGAYFDQIAVSHHVCTTLKRLGVDYYYTDALTYWPENYVKDKYQGLDRSRGLTDRFELIDSGGGAALYRLAICDHLPN